MEGKILQQLGVVAGICEESGIPETIDKLIGKEGRKISVGKAVKALILNATGFSKKALYLTPRFYDSKPVDLLLGEGITATDLHDDCLGTALDALYEYGVTELFYKVSSEALRRAGINHKFVHLDTTTFSFEGEFKHAPGDIDQQPVHITKGYSKDSNPDLNQVVVSMMCGFRSTLPVFLEVLSGNSSDKKSFSESIKAFRKQLNKKELPYFVADSALYSRNNLAERSQTKWVTRVPESLKLSKETIKETDFSELTASKESPGYSYKEILTEYGNIAQRWLIVFSEKAYEKQYETLARNVNKELKKQEKEFWHISNNAFKCEADARDAAKKFEKQLRYHKLEYTVKEKKKYGKRGRPASTTEETGCEYYLQGSIVINPDAVGRQQSRKGYFIIATNELDSKVLDSESLLSVYKAQGISVERGFRFLKDPLFFAESLYLKSERRIMALIMVMGLSLLVYSLAEKKIREMLKKSEKTISDQVGNPTGTPTLRWIFQLFEGVLMFMNRDGTEVTYQAMNMDDDLKLIVDLLGPAVKKMYFPVS
jgi:transposase